MLVLTRRLNDVITIGDPGSSAPPIEVTVIEVRGDGNNAQVRLGISAPRSTPVHRKEVWEQIHTEYRLQEQGRE